jgi:hypothetical protein
MPDLPEAERFACPRCGGLQPGECSGAGDLCTCLADLQGEIGNYEDAHQLALATIGEWQERERALREALEFYADPDTYFAIALIGDPPHGPFLDDVGSDGKPGSMARAALAASPDELRPVPMSDPERETYESELQALRRALDSLPDTVALHNALVWARRSLKTHIDWCRYIKEGRATEEELRVVGGEEKQEECVEKYNALCLVLRQVIAAVAWLNTAGIRAASPQSDVHIEMGAGLCGPPLGPSTQLTPDSRPMDVKMPDFLQSDSPNRTPNPDSIPKLSNNVLHTEKKNDG